MDDHFYVAMLQDEITQEKGPMADSSEAFLII